MDASLKSINEKIINNKKRVQNHGEVFTPKKIINKMLDLPNICEACQNLTSTFLEPAAGEGAFLVEVLNKKINMIIKKYSDDLTSYENYSLLALSTLYGVELLEDNALKCVMNMYQAYYEAYQNQARRYEKNMKAKVLNSAKLIISKNIVQGNFLTKLSYNGNPLVFSEWQVLNFHKGAKVLKVQRTEYTLHEILEGVKKGNGETSIHLPKMKQLDLFDLFDGEETGKAEKKQMKYIPVEITNVYKEEMEGINE